MARPRRSIRPGYAAVNCRGAICRRAGKSWVIASHWLLECDIAVLRGLAVVATRRRNQVAAWMSRLHLGDRKGSPIVRILRQPNFVQSTGRDGRKTGEGGDSAPNPPASLNASDRLGTGSEQCSPDAPRRGGREAPGTIVHPSAMPRCGLRRLPAKSVRAPGTDGRPARCPSSDEWRPSITGVPCNSTG
jgi:hypothetical protein